MQHTASLRRYGNGTTTLTGAPVSGTNEPGIDLQIPASTTNQLAAFAFTVATLTSIWIQVDQTTTLKTNSTSSPGNTITLTPLAPFFWQANSGIACPFTVDVTAFYFTTGSTITNITGNILKTA